MPTSYLLRVELPKRVSIDELHRVLKLVISYGNVEISVKNNDITNDFEGFLLDFPGRACRATIKSRLVDAGLSCVTEILYCQTRSQEDLDLLAKVRKSCVGMPMSLSTDDKKKDEKPASKKRRLD